MDQLKPIRRKSKWKPSRPRPRSERQVLLVKVDPAQLTKRASDLADGWVCTHLSRKLWKPKSDWGNYSVGPLPNGIWPRGKQIAGPVVLCGRCTRKRDGDGLDFTDGDYPKLTPEQLEQQSRPYEVPPLAAKAGK